ncbi:MAG: HNH endonuclease, partial [Clostridia bacterium]|nr:HNH endonuclease [Clostridia bacterium]
FFWLVQSLNALHNYFNIVQIRVALLALFDLKDRNLITDKVLKNVITFLEGFHFSYNAVLSRKSNSFEKIYSSFAIEVRKCTSKEQVARIIEQKLYAPINKIYPSYNDFVVGFIELSYSKEYNFSNTKTKYAINKINCLYSGNEIFDDNGSIEHILPEKDSTNIGNLILLESNINHDADNQPYTSKKELYRTSNYKWVKKFVEENDNFALTNIQERAKSLAKLYYEKVLNRTIEKTSNE